MKVPLVLPMLICAASCVAEEPPPTLERRTYIEFTEGIVISAGERSSSPRSLDGWDCIGSTCDRLINPGGTPSAAAAVFGAGLHAMLSTLAYSPCEPYGKRVKWRSLSH
jgi:hypothetical protein